MRTRPLKVEVTVNQGHDEYERLVRPLEDRMIRLIWGVTRNPEDAEEALQEALGVLWRKWDRIRVHPNPEALIYRICIHSAYDRVRRRMRREKHETLIEADRVSSAKNPADLLNAKELLAAIHHAIGQLSRNQAIAVTMRFVQGVSYGDIGRALGCRENTVRKHVERGRERLRDLLHRVISDQHGVESLP